MTSMVPYTPSHFNPNRGGWLPAAWISPMYNELVHYNPETADPLDIRGDIADSWEVSNGGKTFTFFLNENAAWHDGTPVTSADIVFTFEDIVNLEKNRPWRGGVIRPYFESATAIDEHTVQVDLKYAAAAFFPYLAIDYMQMLPKHQFDKGLDMDLLENRMGSGPFMLTDYEPDIHLEYERNPNYWKPGLPYLDGLKMFILSSPASVMAAHRTGQVLMSHTMVTWMTNSEALQLDEQMRGSRILGRPGRPHQPVPEYTEGAFHRQEGEAGHTPGHTPPAHDRNSDPWTGYPGLALRTQLLVLPHQ